MDLPVGTFLWLLALFVFIFIASVRMAEWDESIEEEEKRQEEEDEKSNGVDNHM